MHPFKNISIVLVEPQNPGNIGSVARAMKNTGFPNLVLVAPVDFKTNEAFSMACKADDILQNALTYPTLKDAIKDARLIVGTTRRKGRGRHPLLTLQEVAPKVLEFSRKNRVSILFGREDKGLTNPELSLCHILVEVPTHGDYPSLNLSHAVLLFCYELFRLEDPVTPSITLAPLEDVGGMYSHIEKTLKRLGYGERGGEYLLKAIMRTLRRLFGRTGLMEKEVNMIRGICTQIEKTLKEKDEKEG